MNEEALARSIRVFLKNVGINSQRSIEDAVAEAQAKGALAGNEMFPVRMTLEIPTLQLSVTFDGEIGVE